MNEAVQTKSKSKIIPALNGNSNGRLATQLTTRYSKDVDVNSLEADLKSLVKGEVRFDNGARALYATDASNYRQVPLGIVIPKTEDDIIQTIHLCRKFNAPLLSRGGGTSLAGQCCNVAVVM